MPVVAHPDPVVAGVEATTGKMRCRKQTARQRRKVEGAGMAQPLVQDSDSAASYSGRSSTRAAWSGAGGEVSAAMAVPLHQIGPELVGSVRLLPKAAPMSWNGHRFFGLRQGKEGAKGQKLVRYEECGNGEAPIRIGHGQRRSNRWPCSSVSPMQTNEVEDAQRAPITAVAP